MGWKRVKEEYGIKHIVRVEGGNICIGSPYIPDLILVDSETGEITKRLERQSGNADLARYQQEFDADPEKLKRLVSEPDTKEQCQQWIKKEVEG